MEFEDWIKLAKQGDALAQNNVAIMYMQGIGVEKDVDMAYRWRMKALRKGNPQAQYGMGLAYENGYGGVRQSYRRAFFWYKKAAEQGYALAQTNLGFLYYYGLGVKMNKVMALEWYIRASEQGEVIAQANLGQMYKIGEEVEKDEALAFQLFLQSAKGGCPLGKYELGCAYFVGEIVQKNDNEAFKWFRRASHSSDDIVASLASLWLGYMYYWGVGTEKNVKLAFRYIGKAAKLKNKNAVEIIEFMGNKGNQIDEEKRDCWFDARKEYGEAGAWFSLGCEYSKERKEDNAYSCFLIAADKGLVEAMTWIGDLYERGKGVKQDYKLAFFYYQKAAEQKDSEALRSLGFLYKYGLGVQQDIQKALYYYRKAVRLGNVEALASIGGLYLGINRRKSVNWYIKAALQNGDHSTEFLIGCIYAEGGLGLRPNLKEAIRWYKKAANGGSKAAKIRLEKLGYKEEK